MDSPDRRTVLRAGGAVLGAGAVAGCLDDGGNGNDETGTDDDGSSEETLGIANIAFTDGEPSGYREYDEVGDTTFDQSETVWLYFEPTGFERESVGDGEVDVDLEMGFSVAGPSGEELDSETDTFSRTAPEDGDIETYFSGNFRPPIPADGGEYTATLSVTDLVADADAEETATFTIESTSTAQLDIQNVTFLAGRPRGYRDFDTVGETYTMLDPIWVYFEPTGFETEAVDGEQRTRSVDLITEIEIMAPNGEVVYTNEDILGGSFSADRLDEYFAFWNARLSPGRQPGTYTTTVSVEDRLSGQSTTATETFTRELASYDQYARRLRTTIEGNLQVSVTSQISNDPAQLTYQSPSRTGTASAVNEIEYIAGAFASLVGNGWDVTGLVATVTDSANDRYRYTILDETASEFINQEISTETYREEVLASLEEL